MRKYHPDIGLPRTFRLPLGVFKLRPTNHAKMAAQDENIFPPCQIDTRKARLFEVVINDHGRTVKLGLRTPLNATRDLCLVVDTTGAVWRLITCWTNRFDDNHRTLRTEEYCHA